MRVDYKWAKSKLLKFRRLESLIMPMLRVARKFYRRVVGEAIYQKNKRIYNKMNDAAQFQQRWRNNAPCYYDRFDQAGTLGTYFWQDLWAAKLIHENKPEIHWDIGSRIDGFVGHLASFRGGIKLIDVRPLESKIPGVDFFCGDATNLSQISDESVESISALCSLEHFGLGRYGDPIDPQAWFKALKEIGRIVKVGGHVYISVPIGKEHLEFGAHRVFYAQTIIDAMNQFELVELSSIFAMDDQIEKNIDIHRYDNDMVGGARFGLFHFIKKEND